MFPPNQPFSRLTPPSCYLQCPIYWNFVLEFNSRAHLSVVESERIIPTFEMPETGGCSMNDDYARHHSFRLVSRHISNMQRISLEQRAPSGRFYRASTQTNERTNEADYLGSATLFRKLLSKYGEGDNLSFKLVREV